MSRGICDAIDMSRPRRGGGEVSRNELIRRVLAAQDDEKNPFGIDSVPPPDCSEISFKE
jgi:hypothetical protein